MGREGEDRRATVHLAASGGGHLELLTSLAHELEDYRIVWVASPGARAARLLEAGEIVRLLPNPGRRALGYGANLRACLGALARERPRVVIAAGAGSIVPFSVLARAVGAKVIFIETMARVTDPSASGRVLSRIACQALVQWPEMGRVYKRSIVCRPALFEQVSPPRGDGEGTFVAVGTHSQPFDRLLELVDRAVDSGLLPAPIRAQVGVSRYRPRTYRARPWLAPHEIEEAVHAARYVVCHAGSGIISSALRAGRRPLVLARLRRHGEHFDDHQTQLAGRLHELGLAVALGERLTAEDLRKADHGPRQPTFAPELPSVAEALRRTLRLASLGTE